MEDCIACIYISRYVRMQLLLVYVAAGMNLHISLYITLNIHACARVRDPHTCVRGYEKMADGNCGTLLVEIGWFLRNTPG